MNREYNILNITRVLSYSIGALQWSPGVFDLVVSLCVSGIKKARLHRL